MNRLFALMLLVIILTITYWLAIFSPMANNFVVGLAVTLLPVATVPVVYFFLVHGVFALTAEHAWQGLSVGIYISVLNLLVWLVCAITFFALYALGLSDYSGGLLLILLFSSQVLMLVHFHRKILHWLRQTKEQGPEST